MDAALVRAPLVLHHGSFPAKALEAPGVGAEVWALARVDAAVSSQAGGLR